MSSVRRHAAPMMHPERAGDVDVVEQRVARPPADDALGDAELRSRAPERLSLRWTRLRLDRRHERRELRVVAFGRAEAG